QSHIHPQEATLHVVDTLNTITKGLPATLSYHDEWYNFKKLNPDNNILLTIDENSYEGGTNGDNHPMALYHEYDGGRAFYTALGHSAESYQDSIHLQLILGGIQYAIGENLKLDYSRAKSELPPERQRFKKTQLHEGGLFEPTEMAILPNYDILIAQRRGELMMYKQKSMMEEHVGFLNDYHHADLPKLNAE